MRLYITLIPLILFLSIIVALLWYVYRPEEKSSPLAGEVTHAEVIDSLQKLTEYLGERNFDTPDGQHNLRSARAMIQGSLGPENLGYPVQRNRGEVHHGVMWPSLWIELEAEPKGKITLLAIAQSDPAPALAFSIHYAKFIVDRPRNQTTRLVFYSPQTEQLNPQEQTTWLLQQMDLKEEEVAGILWLGTSEGTQARLSFPSALTPKFSPFQENPAWRDLTFVEDDQSPHLHLDLPQLPLSARDKQAEVLLQWMPKVELLLNRAFETSKPDF